MLRLALLLLSFGALATLGIAEWHRWPHVAAFAVAGAVLLLRKCGSVAIDMS